MMYPIFEITDGIDTIRFFGAKSPFRLIDWSPSVPGYKDGGAWNAPLFGDGRIPISTPRENVIDTFTIAITGNSQDDIIYNYRRLVSMLQKALSYWSVSWKTNPVFLVARGDCETNTRYAIVKGYSLPYGDDPFSLYANMAMADLTLTIEHGYWQNLPIGQSSRISISSTECFDYPYTLFFDGTVQRIQVNNYASIQNLHSGAFTAEAWIYPLGLGGYEYFGTANVSRIFDKTNNANQGWYFGTDSSGRLYGIAYLSTTNAVTYTNTALSTNQWLHVAMTFDLGTHSDKKIQLYINGVRQTNVTQTAGSGTAISDASCGLAIGNRWLQDPTPSTPAGFHGYIGWTRLSNVVRYSNDFIPFDRCLLPEPDTNTVGQWVKEGTGSTLYNMIGSSGNNGNVYPSETWAGACCGKFDSLPKYSLVFDGEHSAGQVTLFGGSGYDNLPNSTNFTAEAWIRPQTYPRYKECVIVSKVDPSTGNGWKLYLTNVGRFAGLVNFSTINAYAATDANVVPYDRWIHVAMCFNYTTKVITIIVDGKSIATTSITGSGTYTGDASGTFNVGCASTYTATDFFKGEIRLVRISNTIRYGSTWNTIPSRCVSLASDANTLGLYQVNPARIDRESIINQGTLSSARLYLYNCYYRRGVYAE